jgi:hypothetical protein
MSLSDTKIVPGASAFAINTDVSVGLVLAIAGGVFLSGAQYYRNAPNVQLTLTASATNYVEMSDPGVISSNTTGFTAGYTQLYIVTTDASGVTGIADFRSIPSTTNSLDGTNVANSANVSLVGAIPIVFRIDLAAGALADTDVIMTNKVRVIDAYLILRGAGVASTTLTVKNGASAITNAMAASGSDQALVRATTIDDAAYEIAAAGTLRVTSATGATQPAATVYVTAIRVP